jgi:hypothetical protein
MIDLIRLSGLALGYTGMWEFDQLPNHVILLHFFFQALVIDILRTGCLGVTKS